MPLSLHSYLAQAPQGQDFCLLAGTPENSLYLIRTLMPCLTTNTQMARKTPMKCLRVVLHSLQHKIASPQTPRRLSDWKSYHLTRKILLKITFHPGRCLKI